MKQLPYYLMLIFIAVIVISIIADNLSFSGISNSILVKPVPEKGSGLVSRYDTSAFEEEKLSETVYIEKEKSHFLRLERPVIWFTFIKPDYKLFLADNLYCLLILSLCILLIIRISRQDHSRLFSDAALDTIKFCAIIFALFWVLDYGRHLLLTGYIEKITENKYTLEKRFLLNSPLYMVTLLLIIIRNIFNKGNKIQQEQDLTV